jgi:hypothetical protein
LILLRIVRYAKSLKFFKQKKSSNFHIFQIS